MSNAVTGVLLYFGTNADTMIAGKALRDANIESRMLPKPSGVTSEANLVLSIARELEPLATRALSGAGVALRGVIK
jgi:hypothetical protein